MRDLAAFTKILLALMVSINSFLTTEPLVLAVFLGAEYVSVFFLTKKKSAARALAMLFVFACMLLGIQLLCGSSVTLSLLSAMRMAIMANSMVLVLFSTKTQQLTAALVKQCHLSYSYAFMVTAIFRFVPDLLAESHSVSEAQACRGYKSGGSPYNRMRSYMMLIKPMVFRAIARSENMAVSLEMRGFGDSSRRTFMSETHMVVVDYATVAFFILFSVCLLRFL